VTKAQDPEVPHFNWNGGMKASYAVAADAKQRTQVDFLPVIEGDPIDLRIVLITLKERLRLSADRVAVVTFDLSIWLKAVL